jgi:hypothetical protein
VTNGRGARLLKLMEIVYLLETGAFLSLAPWSRLWVDRVVSRSPAALQQALHSPYLRGFIAGLGLLHIFFALRELTAFRFSGPIPLPPAEGTGT